MKSTNKLSKLQLDFLASTPAYTTKSNRKQFNQAKNLLLDEIKKTFGCSWFRLKEGTQKAFEFVCFLSTEKGYFYASASKTASKFDISEKTMYRLLKQLIDNDVLIRRNFESLKHNGLGNAVYFFKKHPYYETYERALQFDVCENDDENNDEKAEATENPYETRENNDKKIATYISPNILHKEFKDLHPNVATFVKNVPKVLNQMFFNKFGGKLRTIWIKVTQAYKYVKHPMLNKDVLYTIAKKLCLQLAKTKKFKEFNEDQLAGYTYKTALNMFYEAISQSFLHEITLNSPDIDLEYDFLANETYVLLPPHKHTSYSSGLERVKYEGNLADNISVVCSEIIYTLENEITQENLEIGFSDLKKTVLNKVKDCYNIKIYDYISMHYNELTFNGDKLAQEEQVAMEEYLVLAKKLDAYDSQPSATSISGYPF